MNSRHIVNIHRWKWITTPFVFLSFGFSSWVFAGEGGGRVTVVYAHESNIAIFATETHTNMPACSQSGNEWALSLATTAGRAQYALLLSAAAQGKQVTVSGRNDCTAWGDRETPSYILVKY
ncbi:hypothetical protein [Aquirhabdus parva]|uniref:Uncharacterized protein n=1 Tax=Aquirhabdus parva TaxID=2283318 RepID=A0A345P2I0_9GAMM|nr:hypothetical protein [Aquirhabdus parva]AXI01489.1 hypothetical protein HYN46_00380 [Aquirhabdus parva]